jgi:hypothetical protein
MPHLFLGNSALSQPHFSSALWVYSGILFKEILLLLP